MKIKAWAIADEKYPIPILNCGNLRFDDKEIIRPWAIFGTEQEAEEAITKSGKTEVKVVRCEIII